MNCPKCEHGMELVNLALTVDTTSWVCPKCGWREKYIKPKTIDGTIEPKLYKAVISYCPHCGGEIKLKIEV